MPQYYNLNVLEIYFIFNLLYVFMDVCVCAYECRYLQKPGEGAGFLELNFQIVVSHPM